jgi:hypothetical protein
MRKPRVPTKPMLATAKADVLAYKASGMAARRYIADDAAAYALASLRLLADLPIVGDASKGGKRKYLADNGESVGATDGDWRRILPTMGASTRPDQGFEKRLLAALAVYGENIGWGWHATEDHGFVIVRTA